MAIKPEIVEMARCDAQELGSISALHVDAHALNGPTCAPPSGTAPRSRRCVVIRVPPRNLLDVHHLIARSVGGTHSFDTSGDALCRGTTERCISASSHLG